MNSRRKKMKKTGPAKSQTKMSPTVWRLCAFVFWIYYLPNDPSVFVIVIDYRVCVCVCKKSSQPTNYYYPTTIMQQPIASKQAKPHRLNILHPLSITHEILTSRTIKSDDSIMIIYQCNEKIKRIFCEIYCCVLV